jgi:hypothetical protein
MVNIEKDFRNKIIGLFNNKEYQKLPFIDRGFAYPNSIRKNAVLFIGINPSYNEVKSDKGSCFYSACEGDRDIHPYFRKFKKLSNNWTHIDLLGIREVKQNLVGNMCLKSLGLEFVVKHLEITKRILEESAPKVIVVNNTLARRYLGKDVDEKGNNTWMGYKFKFDDKIGTDRIVNTDSKLNGIPIFFTSMITGQRALDNGSFERLKWHIDFVQK